jgi:hypothetical protein
MLRLKIEAFLKFFCSRIVVRSRNKDNAHESVGYFLSCWIFTVDGRRSGVSRPEASTF